MRMHQRVDDLTGNNGKVVEDVFELDGHGVPSI